MEKNTGIVGMRKDVLNKIWKRYENYLIRIESFYHTLVRVYKTWTIKNIDDFCVVFQKAGYDINIGKNVVDIIRENNICYRNSYFEPKTLIVSLSDLGLWSARYSEIVRRIRVQGLTLLTVSEMLQFRLGYQDQPVDEWVVCATEEIVDHHGWYLFQVGHGKKDKWVSLVYTHPNHLWKPSDKFVVKKPSF